MIAEDTFPVPHATALVHSPEFASVVPPAPGSLAAPVSLGLDPIAIAKCLAKALGLDPSTVISCAVKCKVSPSCYASCLDISIWKVISAGVTCFGSSQVRALHAPALKSGTEPDTAVSVDANGFQSPIDHGSAAGGGCTCSTH